MHCGRYTFAYRFHFSSGKCFHQNNKSPKKKLLQKNDSTSRDTHKESQKLSVTKTYSLGFNYDAEQSYKTEIQKMKPFRKYLCKRIKQSDWLNC